MVPAQSLGDVLPRPEDQADPAYCIGKTTCRVMQDAQDAAESGQSVHAGVSLKMHVAVMMTAITTGFCPSCRRPARTKR